MSPKSIVKIILFMNIIFSVLLDVEFDYSKKAIEDLEPTFFNTIPEKIYYLGSLINKPIIAFSDLNSDKLTDIITYEKQPNDSVFNFYVHYFTKADNNPRFLEGKLLFNITMSDENTTTTVRNVHIGSFFDEKKACFLVSFNKDKDSLIHYIVCSKSEKNEEYEEPVKLNINSNILIMNKIETIATQLLYHCKDKKKICQLNKTDNNYGCNCDNDVNFDKFVINKDSATNIDENLSLNGGLAYVDINGNCIPDIILSFDKDETRYIEVYEAQLEGKEVKYKYKSTTKIGNSDEFGAFVVTRLNDIKDEKIAPVLGLLIPKIETNQVFYLKNNLEIEYSWSTYLCENQKRDNEKDEVKIFDSDLSNAENWNLTIQGKENDKVKLDNNIPTIIRVGDFLSSSNPGIIVKQIINEKETQISLFERKDGKFEYYAGITMNEKLDGYEGDDFTMGLFFDIDENGSLSFILPTKNGKNHFFLNYKRNIYFLKSKLMNDKSLYYDTNLGATYRYIVTDKKGDRHMDISYQMVQTSDMNIPLPYSLMGLDDTNNYVEYFETISGNYLNNFNMAKSEENNRKGNTPIIPNTQMMIAKYKNSDNKIEWNVDLIVQPMDKIWLFLIIVIVVLIIVLIVIIYLHVKELKEEQKETTKFKSWFA